MPPSSSGVTSHGPTGVACSHVLPCRNSIERYCQSRIETSLATVKPAIASCCFVGAGAADARADDQRELGFPVDGVGVGWEHDVVVRADERLAELGEQRGVRGELVAHLEDVAPVVQALAEDLAGVRDDGRVVGGRGVVGRARLARVGVARARSSPTSRASSSTRVSPSTRAARVPCFGSDRRPAHARDDNCHTPVVGSVHVRRAGRRAADPLHRVVGARRREVVVAAARVCTPRSWRSLRVLDERGRVDCVDGFVR